MPYYKDNSDQVYWLDDEEFKPLIPDECVLISEAEADALRKPSTERIAEQYEAAAQAHLESVAVSWGYGSVLSITSYVGDPDQQFNADAVAFRDWRSEFWKTANAIKSAVKNGADKPDTEADFISMLPAAPEKPAV